MQTRIDAIDLGTTTPTTPPWSILLDQPFHIMPLTVTVDPILTLLHPLPGCQSSVHLPYIQIGRVVSQKRESGIKTVSIRYDRVELDLVAEEGAIYV